MKEGRQRKTNTTWYHIYVNPKTKKKKELNSETDQKIGCQGLGGGISGKVGKQVQSFNYKMNKV